MTKLSWVKVYSLKRLRNIKAITLVELIISLVIVSILVLSFYSFETYSHNQVIYLTRRAKVQSGLNYALEHMSKYAQQASGNINRPPIRIFPPGNPRGFRLWVDFNKTPSDSDDDAQVGYRLDANDLKVECIGGSCPPSFVDETLTTRVLSGAEEGVLPDPLPINPAAGFYFMVNPDSLGINIIEIGLVGRYDPALAAQITTNPQVVMKTRLICNGCSTN